MYGPPAGFEANVNPEHAPAPAPANTKSKQKMMHSAPRSGRARREEEGIAEQPAEREREMSGAGRPTVVFTERELAHWLDQPGPSMHARIDVTSAPNTNSKPAMARPIQTPFSPTAEEVADDEEYRLVTPLLDVLGESVALLTATEAHAAEQAWIEHGEEWSRY